VEGTSQPHSLNMLVSYGQQIHVIRRKLMIYDLRTYTLKP